MILILLLWSFSEYGGHQIHCSEGMGTAGFKLCSIGCIVGIFVFARSIYYRMKIMKSILPSLNSSPCVPRYWTFCIHLEKVLFSHHVLVCFHAWHPPHFYKIPLHLILGSGLPIWILDFLIPRIFICCFIWWSTSFGSLSDNISISIQMCGSNCNLSLHRDFLWEVIGCESFSNCCQCECGEL